MDVYPNLGVADLTEVVLAIRAISCRSNTSWSDRHGPGFHRRRSGSKKVLIVLFSDAPLGVGEQRFIHLINGQSQN